MVLEIRDSLQKSHIPQNLFTFYVLSIGAQVWYVSRYGIFKSSLGAELGLTNDVFLQLVLGTSQSVVKSSFEK
jgi:hypothetical protein